MFKNLFKKKTPNNNSDAPDQAIDGERKKKLKVFLKK